MSTSTPAFARGTRAAFARDSATWQILAGLCIAAASSAIVLYAVRSATLKGIAFGVVAVGSIWFLTTKKPQLALAIILLYLGLLDGYLKLATGSSAVTFVRDALIFSLTIGLVLRAAVTRQHFSLPPLSRWLLAFVAIVLVEVANPNAGTLEHSLAGVRQHLEFIPLFFLAYTYVRTVRALRMFCILLAVVAAANGVADWVQFKETPQQFAAWGPGYSERILGTGSFAGAGRTGETGSTGSSSTRPFGLGSDAGDGGLFAMLALCGIFALAAFSQRRRYQLFAVAMALLAILAIVTSQGRSVVIGSVITVLGFGALTIRSGNRLKSLSGLVVSLAVTGFVIAAVVNSAGPNGFRYNGLGPSGLIGTTDSARGGSIAEIPYNFVTYPFGAGLATVGPASGSPGASTLTQEDIVDVETEFSFLIVETGIPGMLAIVGFVLTLIYLGFSRVRIEPDPEARILLAALVAPLLAIGAQFFVSALTPSVPIGPYLFTVGGIVSYWLIELPAVRRRETPVLGLTTPSDAISTSTILA